MPLFWACCAQYLVVAQVAQLATTTCATNFVLPVSGTMCTTSAKDIIYIISLALVVQIVPLTGKTKLVAQVVVASCATCATAQTSLVPDTHSYLLDFFAVKGTTLAQPL